jgi:hypothetical protein
MISTVNILQRGKSLRFLSQCFQGCHYCYLAPIIFVDLDYWEPKDQSDRYDLKKFQGLMSWSFDLRFETRKDNRWEKGVIRELNPRPLAPNERIIALEQSLFLMSQHQHRSRWEWAFTLIDGKIEWAIEIRREGSDDSIIHRRMVWYRSNIDSTIHLLNHKMIWMKSVQLAGKPICASAKTSHCQMIDMQNLTTCLFALARLDLTDYIPTRETQEIWRPFLNKCSWEVTNDPCLVTMSGFGRQIPCSTRMWVSVMSR